jgi:hypothetical protein
MPDPRLVGLHELRALIHQLNEANLRVSTAHAHLSEAGVEDEADVLLHVKQTIEKDLLPSSVQFLKSLQGGTVEN